MNKIKLFVASGNDLKDEREKTILVIDKLRKVYPDLDIEPDKWETCLPSGNYNNQFIQNEINPLLDQCDIVLVLFYSRVGQFTLEEFQLAQEKNKKIFLYFKTVPLPNDETRYTQYRDVLKLQETVEKEKKILFKKYDTLESFEKILYEDLNLYLSNIATQAPKTLFCGSEAFYKVLRGPNGRFRFLDISEVLLPGSQTRWLESVVSIDHSNLSNKEFCKGQDGGFIKEPTCCQRKYVFDALSFLWQKEIRHAVIVGLGGMGKTVSLLQWWENLLNYKPNSESPGPIPVFIALNEFNQVFEMEGGNFIVSYIIRHYGSEGAEPLTPYQILKVMKKSIRVGDLFQPSMVLLLDGFNEITVEKRQLIIELNHLAEQCPGIQIVLTSRYDMRDQFQWGHWSLVSLLETDEVRIIQYLEEKGISFPTDKRLRMLLSNPMMLTLYSATCEVQKNYSHNSYCSFKKRVETPGELMWNFMEAQVAKIPERVGRDEEKSVYYRFVLKFFLPALGHEMEKSGLFDFNWTQLQERFENLCQRFGRDDFLDTFPDIWRYGDILPVGKKEGQERRKRLSLLKDLLCKEIHMLVEEGNSYRFLHQNFRDYFAAVYVLNEMEIGLKRDVVPEVLSGGVISYYPKHYIGEIEGLHHQEYQPFLVEGEGWQLNENKDSLLFKCLDKCRGIFDGTIGLAVWNIVEILKDFRGGLSGTDLSNLDLSKVLFQEVKCGLFFKDKYLGTVFDGSLITEGSFLSERHIGGIKSVALSKDGKRFLAASHELVAEWDAETGRCLTKYNGHFKTVNSISYSPDEQKVLTASADSMIKEWERVSGKCLMTFEGHSKEVHKAIYSDDGKKILSASRDETIREWNSETGECEKTFTGHSFEVLGAVYFANGKFIISRSSDKTFRIWDRATGKCLYTSPIFPERLGEVLLDEKENVIVGAVRSNGKNLFKKNMKTEMFELFDISKFFCIDFHLEGRKVAAGYYGGDIKIWDIDTGNCLKTLSGQSSTIGSIKYSEDGRRIISGNSEGTIEYWDARNGHLLKTIIGRSVQILSAVFSNDGRRLLIASADALVKEWNLDQGKFSKFFFGHLGSVHSAVYSMDGKRVLSTSSDNTIKEWDLETGKCLKTFKGHSNSVNSAIYSADGTRVLSASSDKTIREWDSKMEKCINVFKWHSLAVNSAVYSSNGMKILSSSCESGYPIKEWNIETGECLRIYTGHKNSAKKVRYIDDDNKILSMSYDGTLKVWCVKDGKCVKSSAIGWLNHYYPFEEEIPPGIKINPISPYKVEVLDTSRNFCQRIENVPLLNLLGCSFKNLHPESRLTEKLKNLMKNYGGIF